MCGHRGTVAVMSVTIVTDVFCDGCNTWTAGTTGPKPEVREARKSARRAGWQCDSTGDWCPDCRPTPVVYAPPAPLPPGVTSVDIRDLMKLPPP